MLLSRFARRLPIAATAVVGAFAGGCGTSAPRVTHSGYVARADAICATAQRSVRAVAASGAGTATLGQIAPLIHNEAAQLRALPRPHEARVRRAELARFLGAQDAIARGYTALARASRRGDGGALAAEETSLAAIDVGALARAYGLSECASAGTVVPR